MANQSEIQQKVNTFSGGLYMDSNVATQPENTYSYAKNIINRDFYQNEYSSNEHSDRFIKQFDSNIIGIVYQEEYNRIFYLLADSSIQVHYEDDTFEEVMNISEFKCEWDLSDCEKSDMTIYTKGCDSYLQFSNNNEYYIVNVSIMLDPVRKQGLLNEFLDDSCKSCNKNCNYFKVFKPKKNIKITPEVAQKGGNLSSGAYLYTARLINKDGSVTNWSLPTNPKFIYSDSNVPGEQSLGRIDLTFSDLDCNFTKIEIATIYLSGSTIDTRILDSQYFSGDSFTYTHIHTNFGNPVNISEVLSVFNINLRGRNQFAFNNKMYYYSIAAEKEYNVQKIANDVIVKFYSEKYSLETAKHYQIKTLPRGENVAFGIWLNNDDGTRTFAGHIPCEKSPSFYEKYNIQKPVTSSGGDDIPSSVNNDAYTDGIVTQTQEYEYKRSRDPADRTDSVNDPIAEDELLNIEKALIESYTTDINDVITGISPAIDADSLENRSVGSNGGTPIDFFDVPNDELNKFANVKKDKRDSELVDKDLPTVEQIAVKWGSILSDLIGSDGKKDLIKLFTPSTIKEVSRDILDAVKRRETIIIRDRKYSIKKVVDYENTKYSAPQGIDENKSQYPGGRFLEYFDLGQSCYKEADTKYPCTTDCNGNLIFGEYAGTPVTHHKIPNENQAPYYESKSIGVPSKITPDADEYQDGYVIVIGAEFSNINIDRDDYYHITGKRLSPNEPYTIGQVKLTDANKTILTKGLITGNYISSNQGKKYAYQNLGVNSFEKCDRFIDINESRMDQNASSHNSSSLYSLDQSALEPYIGFAEEFVSYKLLSGIGYRHYLYSKGKDPSNKLNGRRIDAKGTVQSVNLSSTAKNILKVDKISFAKYVNANEVSAPEEGGDLPLMNKYQQSCLWIQGVTVSLKDKSFVGDGLDHSAPITDARSFYGVLRRNLDNQYGSVENLNYIPVLNGNNETIVRGLIGNRYISPYSFVKTSFVSDKVGEKYPISLINPSKSDRCICDTPEDSVNGAVGKYFWTELPEDGDAANAKNWVNLHSPPGSVTKTWFVANETGVTESDTYYPGTLKTLITYWGEWETNPWGTQISEELEKQRYPFISSQYYLGSKITENHPWDESYLDQFHIKLKQPSPAEKLVKVLIKSFINLALPVLGISDVLSFENVPEMLGDITGMMGLVALWFMLMKVLFTDDFIDDFLNLPKCKVQSEGGIDFTVEKFFKNWNRSSYVFSYQNDLNQILAFSDIKNCCKVNSITNQIFVSDPQVEESTYNGYLSVRPNNYITLSQDKGDLKELYNLNGTLFAHLTDSIYSLVVPQIQIQTDSLPLISGQGNVLNPQLIVGSNPEGYAGIKSINHSINCEAGRFFIDYESGIVYSMTDGLQPISYAGVYNFIKDNTRYINESDCTNEQINQYFSLGYDTRLKRLLLTKYDTKTENSWTLSYDIVKKHWISFHDYFPNNYVTTRDQSYHLSENTIYKHDELSFSYCSFMGEEQKESIIDAKTISRNSQYQSHIIDTDAHIITKDQKLYNRPFTINKIGLLNSRQTTGIINITPVLIQNAHGYDRNTTLTDSIVSTYKNGAWNINELYDYTENTDASLIKYEFDSNPHYDFVNSQNFSNLSLDNFKNRNLVDSWFLTRLIYSNNDENLKLYFRSMVMLVK